MEYKIYKIEPLNGSDGDIYYGSTSLKFLHLRMSQHIYHYKLYKKYGKQKVYSYDIFDKYTPNQCNITLIEICNTREEMLIRESYYIKNFKCVNKNIPFLTLDEKSIKYKNIEYYKNEPYNNLFMFFQQDEPINNNLNNKKYQKIHLIRQLEQEMSIKPFQILKLPIDRELIINETLLKKINTVFQVDGKNPKTFNKAVDYYVKKLKHLFGELKIIDSKAKQVNNIQSTHHIINNKILNYQLNTHLKELNEYNTKHELIEYLPLK